MPNQTHQTQATQQLNDLAVAVARMEERSVRIEERMEMHYQNIVERLEEHKKADEGAAEETSDIKTRLAKVETDLTFAKRVLTPLYTVATALGIWWAENKLLHG